MTLTTDEVNKALPRAPGLFSFGSNLGNNG
jgi:hypothetical protein